MSVQLDEVFDETPGVVCVVLSRAIEAAGWRLVHISETGDTLVWQVREPRCALATLRAVIEPHGEGTHVRVTSYSDHGVRPTGLESLGPTPDPALDPAPDPGPRWALETGERDAEVLDFRPRRR